MYFPVGSAYQAGYTYGVPQNNAVFSHDETVTAPQADYSLEGNGVNNNALLGAALFAGLLFWINGNNHASVSETTALTEPHKKLPTIDDNDDDKEPLLSPARRLPNPSGSVAPVSPEAATSTSTKQNTNKTRASLRHDNSGISKAKKKSPHSAHRTGRAHGSMTHPHASNMVPPSETTLPPLITQLPATPSQSTPQIPDAKMLPGEFTPWRTIREQYRVLNALENEKKILAFIQTQSPKENFVIVNKADCQAKVYSPEGKLLETLEIGIGETKGDSNPTKTRKTTAAGIYSVTEKPSKTSGAYYDNYNNNIFLMDMDRGSSGVALSQVPNKNPEANTFFNNGTLLDNRYTPGSVNVLPNDFSKLSSYIKPSSQVYILPEGDNNFFWVKNNQLNFSQKNYTGDVLTSLPSSKAYKIKIDVDDTGKRGSEQN